jgi:hypothetical protein
MKVLIACECSGTIRDAFAVRGHDAWSCDLKPDEKGSHHHIQGDIFKIKMGGFPLLHWQWDLLIGHPPCQYLSFAGFGFWNQPGRCLKRLKALNFFRRLWEAPIPKICLENPRGCASPTIAKFTQEIQPYYFGDDDLKTTWLWLKGLPQLTHSAEETLLWDKTHIAKPAPSNVSPNGKARYYVDSKTRRPEDRDRTFPGISKAMAEQWG